MTVDPVDGRTTTTSSIARLVFCFWLFPTSKQMFTSSNFIFQTLLALKKQRIGR